MGSVRTVYEGEGAGGLQITSEISHEVIKGDQFATPEIIVEMWDGSPELVVCSLALLAELCFPLRGGLLAAEIGEYDLHHGTGERVEVDAL